MDWNNYSGWPKNRERLLDLSSDTDPIDGGGHAEEVKKDTGTSDVSQW